MSIVIKDLCYTYPGSPQDAFSLKNLTLTVEEGSFIGIAGHTGSGKSTFVQHLNALIPPSKPGVLLVDGHDAFDKKQRAAIRSLIGMVFQYPEYQLFAETVCEDIAFGPKNQKLSEDEIHERVDYAMRLVGLDPEVFSQKSPFELSGGEKRRAALAGVLSMRPKYLVLDEPMAGLDPAGRRAILSLLEKLRTENHCTILMISHSMEDVARHADRLIIFENGAIVLDDTPQNVFAESNRLYELGLTIPTVARVTKKLQEKGYSVPFSCSDSAPLLDWLKGRLPHA